MKGSASPLEHRSGQSSNRDFEKQSAEWGPSSCGGSEGAKAKRAAGDLVVHPKLARVRRRCRALLLGLPSALRRLPTLDFSIGAAWVTLLNPPELIRWNIDKRYLGELASHGIATPETVFIEPAMEIDLAAVVPVSRLAKSSREADHISHRPSDQSAALRFCLWASDGPGIHCCGRNPGRVVAGLHQLRIQS
jgi:hypothetical protein